MIDTVRDFILYLKLCNRTQQLDLELFDYVNWWNHLRLHGTLGYETPVGYRNQRLAQRILD
ncbi:IS3 family transposase, partial [Enterococcus faecium]|uniref:IS3 family transposase n=1 Tax=Enterococcus faecium TaxID=1352 RepID=UPI00295F0F1B